MSYHQILWKLEQKPAREPSTKKYARYTTLLGISIAKEIRIRCE
jgi:hypothetical protein